MTLPSLASESTNAETTSLLSVEDLAARLRVCQKTIRRLIKRHDLAAHYVGRQLRVSEADLAAFLKLRRTP